MMNGKRIFLATRLLLAIASLIVFHATPLKATVKETVLYMFPEDGSAGNYPVGGLVTDKVGNLYGTTVFGGANPVSCSNGLGCGTVYELFPPQEQGGAWVGTVIYEFQGGNDGDNPSCTLVIDKDGNLYGTSVYNFSPTDYGVVVWELSPPSHLGGTWTETNLFNFQGLFFADSLNSGNLLMDGAGNLYGSSFSGGIQNQNCGTGGCGTVFEVSPPQQPGGNWIGAILYAFQGGTDGGGPVGGLVIDRR
ncbi:MAG: choice-of-anchor tandem repeat GloVer-containing protein, partial [Candidatus Dormibacteraceae bacterium]